MIFQKTPDGLRMAGESLYGKLWQSDLARDLGVSRRMIVYMTAGEKKIPERQWRYIAALLEQKAQDCKELAKIIISASS